MIILFGGKIMTNTMCASTARNLWKVDIMLGLHPAQTSMYRLTCYKGIIVDFYLCISSVEFEDLRRSEVRDILISFPYFIDMIYDAICFKCRYDKSAQEIIFTKNNKLRLELLKDDKGKLVIKLPSSEF